MDILSVLKTVGAGLLASTPLGVAAIPVINAFLPEDKQLNEQSSGTDAVQAIDTLPLETQAQLALAKVNLKVEQERGQIARYEAMCKADGQETRAKIVNKAMNCLIVLSLLFVAAVAYVYSKLGADSAFSYEMAAVYLTVSGTFAYVVKSYFGDLRQETTSRHHVANGTAPQASGLAGFINAIKGRK